MPILPRIDMCTLCVELGGSVDLEYRLLGPVEAWADGHRLTLGGPKPRALLATLLLRTGRVVSTRALIDTVWGDDPPDTARALIQTYVSGLRRALSTGIGANTGPRPDPGHSPRTDRGSDPIETRPPGYLLHLADARTDLADFERLTARGRDHAASGDHRAASQLFRDALELWRGAALGGVGEALREEAGRLEETRQAALEDRISADLATPGQEQNLAAELTALVATHRTRERLRGQLMLALYRLDRQADALTVYAEGRAVLADELGIDPGPKLRGLHEAILRSDPKLMPITPATLVAPATPVTHTGAVLHGPPAPEGVARTDDARTPAEGQGDNSTPVDTVPPPRASLLPPAISDFTGRERQLSEVEALLSGLREAMPIAVVSGPGGIGKSAFAVQVAHRLAAAYPDGQLYAELHGFADPVPPAEVLGRLLRALGAEPPEGLAERGDLLRSLVAGRRILLVLDDAGSEAQVRPLLPGSASCGVLITSRARLAGLGGACLTQLDLLSEELGIELLARIAGDEPIRREPEAARRIVALCGGLPLALRIAGARLATRSHWTPSRLAERLADERRRLDELAVGDLEVRSGLGLSYDALDAPARTALRRLGLLGASDVAPWVVAALLDIPEPADAEDVVERLIDAQLLHFAGTDPAGQARFELHDLVRVYAVERAEAEDSHADRAAAVGRALGGWLWLTGRATAAAPSGEVVLQAPRTLWPVGDRAAGPALADPARWFEAESHTISLAVERAAAMDLHALACEAAVTLCSSAYIVDNRFDAWSRTHNAALAAVRRPRTAPGRPGCSSVSAISGTSRTTSPSRWATSSRPSTCATTSATYEDTRRPSRAWAPPIANRAACGRRPTNSPAPRPTSDGSTT
ncbi:DNA-binding SARP family transcriptional activator [Streptomyces turgidiscabies]|uniref:DNA-binding SARP family transcriptional activator n=1 Tax=Streptomyces turgidiscabies TaxID=85558 RepID=A0ABU0RRN1_9ACTN|nr:DNA-binding SARP family transcriptional activator [Streptomyces turgidiscabies]